MQEYLRETAQVCASSVPAGAENDVKATVIVLAYSCSCLVSSLYCVRFSVMKYLQGIAVVYCWVHVSICLSCVWTGSCG